MSYKISNNKGNLRFFFVGVTVKRPNPSARRNIIFGGGRHNVLYRRRATRMYTEIRNLIFYLHLYL